MTKLLKKTTATEVTIVVKGTNNYFLEALLEEVQKNLKENGEDANVFFLDEMADEVKAAIQTLNEAKPKGFIFLGGNLHYFEERFAEIDVPSVLVSETAETLDYNNLSSFSTDDYEAARAAIDYLVRYGHKKIGVIGGSADRSQGEVGARRLEGAMHQLEEYKLPFSLENHYEPCRFSMQGGYDAMTKLLKKNREITGVFCLGDMVAIGALRACFDQGLKVPDDISVLGFDGIEYTKYSVPRLATVQQNVRELAQKSVEDLLWRMNYKREAVHKKIQFRVITGESMKVIKQ
jgi:LacI family transcriptional regulator